MIGYKYFRNNGIDWRRLHGALVPLGMPHVDKALQVADARRLVIKHRALFIRWEDKFDQLSIAEWWHVIKDQLENFDALSRNTRSKVRRGTKRFQTEPIGRKEILSEGYEVYKSAFDRYQTFEEMLSEQAFQQAITDLPAETEFWAVREQESGQMVAFSENLVRDTACFYNTMWFQPDALRAYAGYLLIHEMNKHYLNERRLNYVSDGARNISHQTNVHEFLEQKFKFRRAYARLRVVYFPGVGILVKLLYPFRTMFNDRSASLLQKIAVVLEQERIRRTCMAVWEKM
jgi:hypothetical protein